MSQKQPGLPPPTFVERPNQCLRCGYALEGLAERRCPECGSPFDDRVLIIHGIARSGSGTPAWRRLAWFLVIAGGVAYGQVFLHIAIFVSWWVSLVCLLAILAGGIGLLITSPRERRGAERFAFTRTGVVRLPLKPLAKAEQDSIFIPYEATDVVNLKRISNVWKRLRIGTPNATRTDFAQVRFDAGVQCPDEMAAEVKETIGRMMTPEQ